MLLLCIMLPLSSPQCAGYCGGGGDKGHNTTLLLCVTLGLSSPQCAGYCGGHSTTRRNERASKPVPRHLPVLRHVLVLASVGQQVKCTCTAAPQQTCVHDAVCGCRMLAATSCSKQAQAHLAPAQQYCSWSMCRSGNCHR